MDENCNTIVIAELCKRDEGASLEVVKNKSGLRSSGKFGGEGETAMKV